MEDVLDDSAQNISLDGSEISARREVTVSIVSNLVTLDDSTTGYQAENILLREIGLNGHMCPTVNDALEECLEADFRSEEHTSELQSLMRISYAVFCLKKKNNYTK